MAKKLRRDTSKTIVHCALKEFVTKPPTAATVKLSDILPSGRDRDKFRVRVVTLLRDNEFSIQVNKIPIHRDARMREIIDAIAFFALPGDLGTGHRRKPQPTVPGRKRTNKASNYNLTAKA